MTSLLFLDVLLGAIALYLLQHLLSRKLTASARYAAPPGPKPLPLLGNLLDMPTDNEWLTFTEWGKKYGDISLVTVFGQKIFILNSAQDAIELLEKRNALYSERPSIPMANLIGWQNSLALTPYSTERFKVARKVFHHTIGTPSAVANYHGVEEQETYRFLQRLLKAPEDVGKHVRTTAGAIILRISYGYHIQEHSDPFVTLADKATDQFSNCVAPGSFMVNLIPPLQYLPAWFPGAGFHKVAKEWGANLYKMAEDPHNYVKQQMSQGTAEPSVTSTLLEEKPDAETEYNIKWAAASMYSGGADTTVAAIHSFFKAMLLYPEVQRKAQAEIDAVIGRDRFPTCVDREVLPYTSALAMEVLRWHTVVPSGLPHLVTEDNVYKGYLIPKGSMIIANIWGMSHDSAVYPSPSTFDPERYITSKTHESQRDPRTIAFGFGRRICPGRVLADSSVFLSCAMTLAAFSILPCEGEEMHTASSGMDQMTGTISHPAPFKCKIEPRSEAAIELINVNI